MVPKTLTTDTLQLDLHGAEDADALLTAIGDRPVTLLIVDTLAMSFGAGNESDGKDVTQFLTHVAQVRDKLNCHVMLVHRSGKDRARGAALLSISAVPRTC